MKREKILSIVVFLLVLVVGFQSYYLYNINNQKPTKSEPVIVKKIEQFNGVNPFEEFQKMQQEMDKIFNSMNSNFSTLPEFEEYFSDISLTPSLNMKDLKDRYELSISLPGANEKNIKIGIHDGVLKVEAKTEKQSDSNSSNFIKKEIYEGSFVRSVTLPKDAKGSEFKSEFKNGVLKITIPKG
jgi:HSP20 family protein